MMGIDGVLEARIWRRVGLVLLIQTSGSASSFDLMSQLATNFGLK